MAGRDLCIMACTFCRAPDFLAYLQEIDPAGEVWTESGAKDFILVACQIKSRAELDRDQAAQKKFHDLIRLPFVAWREKQRGN